MNVLCSVTTFGEISPFWQNFKSFLDFFKYLANFCTYFGIFMLLGLLSFDINQWPEIE